MVTRVLTVSILAGLLAGLIVAALQHVTTTPLILKAETYEAALALKAPTLASAARAMVAKGITTPEEAIRIARREDVDA